MNVRIAEVVCQSTLKKFSKAIMYKSCSNFHTQAIDFAIKMGLDDFWINVYECDDLDTRINQYEYNS